MTRTEFQEFEATRENTSGFTPAQLTKINNAVYRLFKNIPVENVRHNIDHEGDYLKTAFEREFDKY